MEKTHVTCIGTAVNLSEIFRVGPILLKGKHARYVIYLVDGRKEKIKFYSFEGCSLIQATNVLRQSRFDLITALQKYHNMTVDLSKFGDDDTFTVHNHEFPFEPKTLAESWIDKFQKDVTNLEMLNEIRDIYKAIIKRNEQDDALHKSKTADMQKAYAEINEAMQQLGTEKSKLFTMLMETKDKRHQRYVEMERRLVDMVKSCQNIKREVENMFANIETKIPGFDKEGRLVIKMEAVKEMTELLPYQKSLNAAITYLQNFLFDFGGPDEERRQLSLLKDADEAIASLIREMKHMRLEEQSYRPHSAKGLVEAAINHMSATRLDVKTIRELVKEAVNALMYHRGSKDDSGNKSVDPEAETFTATNWRKLFRDNFIRAIAVPGAESFTGLEDVLRQAARPVGNYGRSPGWIKAMEESIGRNTAGGGNYKPATDWEMEAEAEGRRAHIAVVNSMMEEFNKDFKKQFPDARVLITGREGYKDWMKRDIGENDVQKAISGASENLEILLHKAEYEHHIHEDAFHIPVAKALSSTAHMYNLIKGNCMKEDVSLAAQCLDHMMGAKDAWGKYKKAGLIMVRDQVIKAIQYLEKIAYGSNDQPKQEQEPTPDEKLSVDGEMLKQMDEIWIHRPGQWPIPAKITPEENMRIQIQAAKNEALYAINWANDQVGNTTTLEGKEFERKSVYEAVTATRNLYNKMVQFGIKTGTQQSEVASRALEFVKTANHLMSTEIRQFYGVKRNLREAIVMIDSIQLPDLKPAEPKKEEAPFREALETAVTKAVDAVKELDNLTDLKPTPGCHDPLAFKTGIAIGSVQYLCTKMYYLGKEVDLKSQITKGEAAKVIMDNLEAMLKERPPRYTPKFRKLVTAALKLLREITFPEATEPAPAPVSYEAALDKAIESLKVAERVLIQSEGKTGMVSCVEERTKEAIEDLEILHKRVEGEITEVDKAIRYRIAIAKASEAVYVVLGRLKAVMGWKEMKILIGTAVDTLVALKDHPADDHEELPTFDIGGEG